MPMDGGIQNATPFNKKKFEKCQRHFLVVDSVRVGGILGTERGGLCKRYRVRGWMEFGILHNFAESSLTLEFPTKKRQSVTPLCLSKLPSDPLP